MSPDTQTPSTIICPTCGTRLSANATRCLVCGSVISQTGATKTSQQAVQGSRMPEITLSLPAALGFLALFLGVGAILLFLALKGTGSVVEPTPVPTETITPTITLTPTATITSTPVPTATELPPLEYTVKQGDTCTLIAVNFNVSVQSIVLLNNLTAACDTLYVGQKLKVPQPTPTASPQPTATLSDAEATEAACQKFEYTVKENDTPMGIAANFNVRWESIRTYNGLTSDIVYSGQKLQIPLCQRLPTPGATPTPTIPPPYPAPNLLLPADGAAFTLADDTVTVQWASVGTLRENEAYVVSVEDITEGQGRKLTEYVTDTKFIIPTSFRPSDNTPHVMRWTVMPVRQVGTDPSGKELWDTAGAVSERRVFTWSGVAISGAAPTP
jgi:LysM repeat protein